MAQVNKLTLNIEKSFYITFGNCCDSVPSDLQLDIDNSPVSRVENGKYLGITIDLRRFLPFFHTY